MERIAKGDGDGNMAEEVPSPLHQTRRSPVPEMYEHRRVFQIERPSDCALLPLYQLWAQVGGPMKTDPRTRQPYPPDGTTVIFLPYGSAHWYTGTIRYDPVDKMHRVDCPELEGQGAVGFLEDAAHWSEVE